MSKKRFGGLALLLLVLGIVSLVSVRLYQYDDTETQGPMPNPPSENLLEDLRAQVDEMKNLPVDKVGPPVAPEVAKKAAASAVNWIRENDLESFKEGKVIFEGKGMFPTVMDDNMVKATGWVRGNITSFWFEPDTYQVKCLTEYQGPHTGEKVCFE